MPRRNTFSFKPLRQSRRVAHPIIRTLVDKMNEQGVTRMDMCLEAGLPLATFDNWRKASNSKARGRISPLLFNVEACFNVLGYTLQPVPTGDVYQRKHSMTREFLVTSPNGVTHRVYGLTEFCKEHGLHFGEMSRVASGVRGSYKGWTVVRADKK